MKTKVEPATHNAVLRDGALDDKELEELYVYCTSDKMKEWWYAMSRSTRPFFHRPLEYSCPRIFVESDYTYLEPIFDVLADKIARYSMTRTAFLKAQIVIETMAMIFEWEAEGYSDSAPGENGRDIYMPHLDKKWSSRWDTNEYGVIFNIRENKGWEDHLMRRLSETANRKWSAFKASAINIAEDRYTTGRDKGHIEAFMNKRRWAEV